VGHGRVGKFISRKLTVSGTPFLVVETSRSQAAELQKEEVPVIIGNAADPEVAAAANIGAARCLLVAIPDAFESGQVVEQARAINPDLPIIVRAHSSAQEDHVMKFGATKVVMGEQEIARAMVASVPDAPRTPVLSSVEEAEDVLDEAPAEAGEQPAALSASHASGHVLGAKPHSDDTGGNAPEEGPASQDADQPGR
jgi:CPA2 family monovalent cation:H+ antiporter-2